MGFAIWREWGRSETGDRDEYRDEGLDDCIEIMKTCVLFSRVEGVGCRV